MNNENNNNIPTPKVNNNPDLKEQALNALENQNNNGQIPPVNNNVNNGQVPPIDNNVNNKPVPDSVINTRYQSDSQTIGKVSPDRQKSPIAMIVLFGLLVGFLLFMEPIINFVNDHFGTNLKVADSGENTDKQVTPSKVEKKVEEPTKVNATKMEALTSDLVLTLNNLSISNIQKNNNEISYTLTNTGTDVYKFNEKLYLEFYDDSNTFISRSLVDYSKDIKAKEAINLGSVSNTSLDNVTKIKALLLNTAGYSLYTLTGNTLTCSNNTNELVYTFDDNKLKAIQNSYTYTKVDDTTYANQYLEATQEVNKLNEIDGIDAVITQKMDNTGYIVNVNIDLTKAKLDSLNYRYYYTKDTTPTVINFEISALGFKCR